MARPLTPPTATIGAAEQGSAVVLVTVFQGRVVDRRRVELIAPGLPTHPHHHEGSWAVGRYLDTPGARAMPLAEAVTLVEQVRASAASGARDALAAIAAAVPMPIGCVAIRVCPSLPPTIEGRIRDHRAQTMADGVMYREVLAEAARARGWQVEWYDRAQVFDLAGRAAGVASIDPLLREMGRAVGPPWQALHKLAAAAAIVAGARGRVPPGSRRTRT